MEGYETRTRQVLIDPMLRTLGWDVGDPNSVELEYGIKRKWADYALMESGRPIAVVEAKSLGTPLNDDEKMQALNYANMDGIDYMVVTNGDHWQMFDVFKRGQLDDRILVDFRLTQDEPYACALQALGLWRPNLASGEPPKEAATPVLITPSHDESVPSTPEPSSGKKVAEPSNNGDWEPLTSLKVERGQKLPTNTNIKFPDSSTKPLKHWTDMLVFVAEYLVKTGKISAQNCPVIKGNSKLYLLHTEPIHRNLKEFMAKREIGNGLWVLTHFSADKMHENACWLLDKFGVNPSTVLVSTNPN